MADVLDGGGEEVALLGLAPQPSPLKALEDEVEALERLLEGSVVVVAVGPDDDVVQVGQADLPTEAVQRGLDHALHVGRAGHQAEREDVEFPLALAGDEGEAVTVVVSDWQVPEAGGQVEGVVEEVVG